MPDSTCPRDPACQFWRGGACCDQPDEPASQRPPAGTPRDGDDAPAVGEPEGLAA